MPTATLASEPGLSGTDTSLDGRAPVPPAPATVEATGIARDQIAQLLVKTLYLGEATGLALAARLRLPYALLEPLVEDRKSVV